MSEPENMIIKRAKSEEQKEEKLKKSKQNLRDLWDTIKGTKICIVEVPKRERKEQREYLMK